MSTAQAFSINSTGGVEVMDLVVVDQAAPGRGEAWIEHDAIGVNYLDVMQRKGTAPIPLPSGLGLEGAGRVLAVGDGVTNVGVGDRVAYALGPIGSYATGRLYPAERLLKLPSSISADDAAALLFKGLTAQYLIHSTYPVGPGTMVLLYGAAGALGRLLAPWATHLGAEVIGVVSKPDSVERARAAGCRHVLVWSADLPSQVERVTGGRMADVVYDGIGRTTFDASLAALRSRGMMVSMGASSGAPDPVSVVTLNKKSLFLTRPSLAAHIGSTDEYRQRATVLFDAVERGIVRANIWRTLDLDAAQEAHRTLETGASAGAILLKP